MLCGIHKGLKNEPRTELRTQQGFLLPDQFKKFLLEAGIVPEITSNNGINHACLWLFHTSPLHAVVLCFDDNS
jgi:hypothetical protein